MTNESDPAPTDAEIVVEEVTDRLSRARHRPRRARSPAVVIGAAPTPDELAEIVASPATVLFAAKDERGSGRRVVDAGAFQGAHRTTGLDRGRRRGRRRSPPRRRRRAGRRRVGPGPREGARTVDLTSRPSRLAANRLYERMGFARRETNVYRYRPSATDGPREHLHHAAWTLTTTGVRLAVKDIIDVEGVPTTAGCRAVADRAEPAPRDAPCLAGRALRRCGHRRQDEPARARLRRDRGEPVVRHADQSPRPEPRPGRFIERLGRGGRDRRG